MSDFTQVSHAGMTAGIDSLSKANRDMQGHLDTLKGQLSNSLAKWAGAAPDEYRKVQKRWDAQAIELNNVVAQMTSVLSKISQGYQDNERKVQQRWS